MNKVPLVSVIIPTYNRFNYLLNAIQSVKSQTYKAIEIIVVNDCSTQSEYYNYRFEGVTVVHLAENSKEVLGMGCAARVRNVGLKLARGEYIAFLDDDDIWFPHKIEQQIAAMQKFNVGMSCTDGLSGSGPFVEGTPYPRFNAELHIDVLKRIYEGSPYLKDNEFPLIWKKDFLLIHNCCVTSSVVIKREIVNKIGFMELKRFAEDYDYWLRALEHTDCIYLKEPCFYYDERHGDGQNY
jgi:O-antigen biosynthesis protein